MLAVIGWKNIYMHNIYIIIIHLNIGASKRNLNGLGLNILYLWRSGHN